MSDERGTESLRAMSTSQRLAWVARHPARALGRAGRKLIFPTLLRTRRGLYLGAGVDIKGMPHVEIHSGARIVIGQRVTLNSWNRNYHVNMFAPVKLVASSPGAIVEVGDDSRIHGACLHAVRSIRIGKKCLIAANTQIFDASGHEVSFVDVHLRLTARDEARPIEVEDNVWIGAHCIILPGITIGTGSVVAAGSIVTKDVPPYVVVAGNPARIVKDCRDERNPRRPALANDD